MEAISLATMLPVAFGLGLLHALDADHIMAVTGMSSTRTSWRASLGFCASWALGHAGALLLIGVAVLLLGAAVPTTLSALAEQAVALVLMAIGLWVLWDIRQRRLHIHFHTHDGLPGHVHWDVPHDRSAQSHQHDHRPLMVGMLHGIAGSAPLLALLPASNSQSAWFVLAYLGLFGIGVFIAMLVFGGVLGRVMEWFANRGKQVITLIRLLVASGSIGMGGYLMLGSLK